MATRRQHGARLAGLVISLSLLSSAAARTIYVDRSAPGGNNGASWTDAFTDLLSALEAAHGGDEIRVAQGRYTPDPNVTRKESFELTRDRANGVQIRGGYAGWGKPDPNARDIKAYRTILSGDLKGNDDPTLPNNGENSYGENCHHVVSAIGVNEATVLEGFDIVGGNTKGSPTGYADGGGLYNVDSSLRLVDCNFVGNFSDNHAGAVWNSGNGTPCLIRCRFSGNQARYSGGAIYNLGRHPVLLRCTFSRNGAKDGAGLYNNSLVDLIGCAFYGNSAGNGGGGVYNDGGSANLINCLFSGNQAYLGGGLFNSGSSPKLINCTLSLNSADDSGGGLYNSDASPTLTNCILWANSDPEGREQEAQIYTDGGVPVVSYCCIQGWRRPGSGNFNENPHLADADGLDNKPNTEDNDLHLRPNSPCIDAGDSNELPSVAFDFNGDPNAARRLPYDQEGNPRICQSAVDMGAFEFYPLEPDSVIYVDARVPGGDRRLAGRSWATPFVTLHQALQRASDYRGPPREIWVAAGTYTPEAGGVRDEATFSLVPDVNVYGGFAGGEATRAERDPNRNVTILSGDLQNNDVPIADPYDLLGAPSRADNSYHVLTVRDSTIDANTVLDGFTVTGGIARGSRDGGGIYITEGSPTIRHCTFQGNAAADRGGAIYCGAGRADINECTLRANSADLGAGIYCDSAAPTIRGSTIANNCSAAGGGGIACVGQSTPVIENNVIRGNTMRVVGKGGGGIACLDKSAARILRNTIQGNAAYQGGGIYCRGADPTILNNMIFANTAVDDGGGICAITKSSVLIRNNTIVRNEAQPQGGGIYCENSRATIVNCILWGNVDDFVNWGEPNDCSLTYCCIQDGDSGTGNISIYPYFVDPEHDDYRLTRSSPCIDAGKGGEMTIALQLSGEKDRYGNDRVNFMPVDMGAQETAFWKRTLDADGDHLPDQWEKDYLGGLQWDEDDDPDGDAYPNSVEFRVGTHPGVAQPRRPVICVGSPGSSAPNGDGSPQRPFTSIQKAINEVSDRGRILVAAGDFHERLTIDDRVLFIEGGYDPNFKYVAGWTTLDADRQGRGVLYINVPDGLLKGFKITGGWEKDGAGMYLYNSSPAICRNVIRGNQAKDDGGGVSFYNQCQGLFEDNWVQDNNSVNNAGGIYCRDASPRIYDCNIVDNEARGGSGGAMRVRGAAQPDLWGCKITGNTATKEGGAIICREPRPADGEFGRPFLRIRQCTISGNFATGNKGRGGLVLRPHTHAVIEDSNLCDNTAPQVWASKTTIAIEGLVEILDEKERLADVDVVRTREFPTWDLADVNVVGTGELRTALGTELVMGDCSLQCRLTGSGTITVPKERELRIEGQAQVNLATDPARRGIIDSNGLLYVGDGAEVRGADIHADGDRYMDLDPSAFAGLIEDTRFFVTITEGIGHTRGGLLDLRGRPDPMPDAYPDAQFPSLYRAAAVPPFDPCSWTLEVLHLKPGAKLNLANRFDYNQGGADEVLYVRKLILDANSVLNTAFNKICCQELAADPCAVVESVPLLGFSLRNIAFEDTVEFSARVRANNGTNTNADDQRIGVEHTLGGPERRGVMRMCNTEEIDANSPSYGQVIAARAKGLFAKSKEPRIQVRFEYLFCDPAGAGELVVYLSDSPELIAHDDPNRVLHYVEVGRVLHPPSERPGGWNSNTWGVFEKKVAVRHLKFLRGTRIELELLGPKDTAVLINNWDPGIYCTDYYCGDVTSPSLFVDATDFLAILSECGRRIDTGDESDDSAVSCLDGFFCADKYVTVHDAQAQEWLMQKQLSLCHEDMFGDDAAASTDAASTAPPAMAGAVLHRDGIRAAGETQNPAAALALAGQFVVAAKRYESSQADFLSDRLYGLGSGGDLTGKPLPLQQDHYNGKLVRDPAGHLYQLNLDLGLVGVANNRIIVAPGDVPFAPEPRHGESARVYVGLQERDNGLWSRPLLDAAFDFDAASGYLYVVPVVVVPELSEPYVAAAKLRLSGAGQSPSYTVEQLFDDQSPDNDNMARSQLREVEVDRDGNVYVLNCHYLNSSDALWVYRPDGQWQVRLELQKLGISAPVGLCVSAHNDTLYLASAENPSNASSVKVYLLSTTNWGQKPVPSIEIRKMGHVTDITEDADSGTVCVVGFEIPKTKMPVESQWLDGSVLNLPPFYEPRLALIPPGAAGPVEAIWPAAASVGNDMRLPLSVISTGGTAPSSQEKP